jgi:precorrin-4/cobalt-precorrin-4 C11-methyltransferase
MKRLVIVVLLLVSWAALPSDAATKPKVGKFYIVSMGTANDLVTRRAMNVMAKADVFLVGGDSQARQWGEFIGRRPVWFCPEGTRVLYGADPSKLTDPGQRETAIANEKLRRDIVARILEAVYAGKTVVPLQFGDATIFGMLWYLELLPKDLPSEVIPGVGAVQAVTAAVKACPVYGYDTNSMILTLPDWPARAEQDSAERLMEHRSSMVFYTMGLNYPELLAQLRRHYPADTPMAVVCYAGDPRRQQVIRTTVAHFLEQVDYLKLPGDTQIAVGKFLTCGQARRGAVEQTCEVKPGGSN